MRCWLKKTVVENLYTQTFSVHDYKLQAYIFYYSYFKCSVNTVRNGKPFSVTELDTSDFMQSFPQ